MNHVLGNGIIWYGAIAVAIVAIVSFLKKAFVGIGEAYAKVKAVLDLVDHELRPNGGGSIKDHTKKSMETATTALTKVEDLTDQFNAYREDKAREAKAQWNAINSAMQSSGYDCSQCVLAHYKNNAPLPCGNCPRQVESMP